MSTWTFLYEFTEFYRVSYRVWGRPCPYIFWPHQLIREKDWTYYSPAKSCSLVLWRPVGRAQSSPSLPSLPSFSLRRARCTRLVTPSITASNISDIDLYLRYRTRYFTARLHFSSIAKWFRYLFFLVQVGFTRVLQEIAVFYVELPRPTDRWNVLLFHLECFVQLVPLSFASVVPAEVPPCQAASNNNKKNKTKFHCKESSSRDRHAKASRSTRSESATRRPIKSAASRRP